MRRSDSIPNDDAWSQSRCRRPDRGRGWSPTRAGAHQRGVSDGSERSCGRWRSSPGVARGALAGRLARVLNAEGIVIAALDAATARAVGELCGRSRHADVVDVHLVLHAREMGHRVVTSDPGDLHKVDPTLPLIVVRAAASPSGSQPTPAAFVSSAFRIASTGSSLVILEAAPHASAVGPCRRSSPYEPGYRWPPDHPDPAVAERATA